MLWKPRAQGRSLPLAAWLAHRNTNDHTAHDVTELEVCTRSSFMVVVALNAGRGDGFVRVDRGVVDGIPQLFFAVKIFLRMVRNELETFLFQLRLGFVLLVDWPQRQQRVR